MTMYRKAQENYFLQGKPVVMLENGEKVFSLVTPPPGSRIARRRIRLIMANLSPREMLASSKGRLTTIPRTPHAITIAVTYRCQCSCAHCSAAQSQEQERRSRSALTFDELRNAIEQAVDLGSTCVVLTGGEPLLHDRIFDLISSVDRSRSICTIFTNGEYLLDSTVQELKRAGVFGVYVSFDYSSPERHDANRQRPGLFQKAAEGLARCQRAGIPTGISTYATREKIETGELDKMMELAKSLQVLEVFLFDVIPTGRLSEHRDCILTDSEADTIRALRERYNHFPEYPGIIHQTMFSSIAYPCVAEGCPAAIVTCHLRANGDLCPCDFTPISFGNIRKQSMRTIWQSMSESRLYAKPSVRCRLSRPDFWRELDRSEFSL
jgi:MoaA/NifB/PqqE/SkfB family radical SAM enzyme